MRTLNLLNLVAVNIGVASLTLTGCDAPGADGSDGSDGVELRDGYGYSCPTWQCGLNSAEVNGRTIRELNLDGIANTSGIKIVGFTAPLGVLGNYSLAVEKDELVAKGNGPTLRGLGLIGATILVKEPGTLSLPLPITILGYEKIPSWAENGPDVATYALLYPDVGSVLGARNVCNGDLTDVLATAAVVLGGETYDLPSKTVNPGLDRWFTIACAGSAAAKMRLLNYGPQSNFDGAGHPATVAQRQSVLKMITADYCGNGTSYTANGTPLQYEDAAGTVSFDGTPGAVESVWTQNGALCLDTTRISGVQVGCNLPSCAGFNLNDGMWASYVPNR